MAPGFDTPRTSMRAEIERLERRLAEKNEKIARLQARGEQRPVSLFSSSHFSPQTPSRVDRACSPIAVFEIDQKPRRMATEWYQPPMTAGDPSGAPNYYETDGTFVCQLCGRESVSNRGLKGHYTRMHKAKFVSYALIVTFNFQRPYKCHPCNRCYSTPAGHRRHTAAFHRPMSDTQQVDMKPAIRERQAESSNMMVTYTVVDTVDPTGPAIPAAVDAYRSQEEFAVKF